MGINPRYDATQLGSQISNQDVPFDAEKFNAAVLDAIEQYKSSTDPSSFNLKDELQPDEYILLYLVTRTFLPESHMDLSMCRAHLRGNRSLFSALRTAYISHNFASLLFHDAMPDDVKERAPKQGQNTTLSTSGGLQDLQHS
ncbi:unnamed protein product, partial [Rhizoctonia solani]